MLQEGTTWVHQIVMQLDHYSHGHARLLQGLGNSSCIKTRNKIQTYDAKINSTATAQLCVQGSAQLPGGDWVRLPKKPNDSKIKERRRRGAARGKKGIGATTAVAKVFWLAVKCDCLNPDVTPLAWLHSTGEATKCWQTMKEEVCSTSVNNMDEAVLGFTERRRK